MKTCQCDNTYKYKNQCVICGSEWKDEIQECPFCGKDCEVEQSQPSKARHNEGAVNFRVTCPPLVDGMVSGCVGSSLNSWQLSEEDAVFEWNKRV